MRKPSYKRALVCLAIQIVIFIAVIFSRGIVSAQSTKDVLMCICDGFFTSGGLMLVAGGLAWTNGQGVSDGMTYSVSRFFKRRGPGYEENRRESFSEYRERKHANKPKVMEMLICGALFVAIAAIILIPYSKA